MNLIRKLICRVRGHRWGKSQNIAPLGGLEAWIKVCRRCGATAPVKRRKTTGAMQ